MNLAFSLGFLTVNVFFFLLFLYLWKNGKKIFRSYLKFENPSNSPNKESSFWANSLLSHFFSHLRDPKVASNFSKKISKSITIVSAGSDPQIGDFTTVNATSDSPEQVQVPIKWDNFSFNFQQVDGFLRGEIDVHKLDSILSFSVVGNGINARLVGETKCDFDLSIILWKKYTVTECPIIGDLVRALFLYYAHKKDIIYPLPPLNKLAESLKKQDIVQTEVTVK